MIKIGSHISFAKPDYLEKAAKESIENGANCMMIYLGPPQTTMRVAKENYHLEQYQALYAKKIKPEDIIVHAPYIVNPSNPAKRSFAVDFLVQEIKRMNYINAKYLVLHPGAHTTYTIKEAKESLICSLKEILAQTKDVVIVLETMAGNGSNFCNNFEILKEIIDEINSERIQICLDTCHIWDAGYNLKNYDAFKKYLKDNDFLKHIKVIHLNDSKNELNSKKDRHANLNQGYIGLETLKKFVFDKDFDNIPIILETPYINNKPPYKEEIAMLLNKEEPTLF
ncbi:deoxyribonuclease IV [Metamycoplasma alkalescens]|uniref:Probable endonuclease 4 n=2 Tax=Metamycoplasma alkalescens TaxID=45363 RepID=N9U0Z5_9BACT|nr:deoxyribonuclease IV [Metamycoplasma alkalescens]ENY54212.1 Endonuclease IV [Metamycoplasma alkalescens 14918]PYF42209.1 deoxyribonuclease-4 [Metamycoplasma alkalescens]SYV90087.1 putative endonuclease 4 [Metamycoplasma alkalescens]